MIYRKDIKVQIIIPVYNVEEYIRKCIKSVLTQTYKNLEIILVDDGQTDRQIDAIQDFLKDGRIKLITQENKGLQAARNAGLDQATGEYITFLDSDDFYSVKDDGKYWIQDAVNVLNRHTNCDICQCGFRLMYPDKEVIYGTRNITGEKDGNDILKSIIYQDFQYVVVWNKVYRRKVFDILRFPEGKNYEDEYIIHKILLNRTIYVLEDTYIGYRQRQGQIKSNKTLNSHTFDWVDALLDRIETLKDNKFGTEAINRCYMYGFKQFRGLYSQNKDKSSVRVIDDEVRKFHSKFKSDIKLEDISKLNSKDRFIQSAMLRNPTAQIKIWSGYAKIKAGVTGGK